MALVFAIKPSARWREVGRTRGKNLKELLLARVAPGSVAFDLSRAVMV
jgi:hypothetical protein